MFGWTGKILYINLSNKKTKIEDTSEYIDHFIGGRGINQILLFKSLKNKNIEPLSEESPLILGAGPFVGTLLPSACRLSIDFKNVINNGIGSCNCGGHFAPEMKFAGYDHIVISGIAEKPVYLFIKDENVFFKDAREIWGKNTWDTENIIRKIEGDDIRTLSIGIAGENLVKFASIIADRGRSASYGGGGALMGSKNLKCVAIKGTSSLEIAYPSKIINEVKEINNIIHKSRAMQMHRIGGTLFAYLFPGENRANSVKNMSDEFWNNEKINQLTRNTFDSKYLLRRHSCFSCPVFCSSIYKVRNLYCEGLQANSWRAFTSNMDLIDPEKALYSHALTNLYGMDGDHTSAIIAWAIECYENGILTKKDIDGIELTWGNGDSIIKMIKKIAKRDGFGNVLAEGLYEASKVVGKNSLELAMLSKKCALMEDAMRSHKAWALGIVLSNKGSGHLRGAPIAAEEVQEYPFYIDEKESNFLDIIDPKKYEGKAELVTWHQKYKGIIDSVGICALVSSWNDLNLYSLEKISNLLNIITGKSVFSKSNLLTIGSRINNLERSFNLLHAGFDRTDDYPPSKLIDVPVTKGKYKGERLEINKWDKMLDEYYKIQEWDIKNGRPTKKILKDLKLDFIEELKGDI